MDKLTIVTLNVKGLNVPEKRRMLLNDMNRLAADVVLLQETHFQENTFPILQNRFYPTEYHSTYPEAKSRGTSIPARIPWTLIAVQSDPMGRFLLVKGLLGECESDHCQLLCPK